MNPADIELPISAEFVDGLGYGLSIAAKIVEESTSWGLSRSQREAVESFKRFAAGAIRKQEPDQIVAALRELAAP